MYSTDKKKVGGRSNKNWEAQALEDSDDQDSEESDGGLRPTLPYHMSTYTHTNDILPYVKIMNQYLSTFSSLPQLGGLMINNQKVYMCPYGGNNHVAPLWTWFAYNGHLDDV